MEEKADNLFLLQITVDGKVVADAPLRIYDPEKTMAAFMDVFPDLIPNLSGLFLKLMTLATSDPKARGAGILIQRQSAKPQIVLANGNIDDLNRAQRRHPQGY